MNSNSFVELNKIVILIRKAKSRQQNNDAGLFSTDCQKNSVPKELLSLIRMFIDGTEDKFKLKTKLSQATLTCAQLILLNYKPNTGAVDKTTYLSQERETPFYLMQRPQFVNL